MNEPNPNSEAGLFLKYNYPETKDMCKQFLTLDSAVLVLSLTFSEKIVNYSKASPLAQGLVIAAWIALLLAIIFCGVGLLLITIAAGDAVYNQNNYLRLANRSYKIIVLAGASFVLGLILLIGTAVTTVYPKPLPDKKVTANRVDGPAIIQ